MSQRTVRSLPQPLQRLGFQDCTRFRAHWLRFKKLLSSPWNYTRPEDCAGLPCAKTATLNTSALSNPDSLILSLTSDTLPNMILKSIVDSRSSDSFIDSAFIQMHHLPTSGILPIKLQLLDGTSNSIIMQALDLRINFPTRETQNLTFFVTPLDQGCTIVLGYRWLTCFNLMIDWVLGSIIFRQPSHHDSKMSPPTETLPSSAIPPVVVKIPST